jgi:hypothetical protein
VRPDRPKRRSGWLSAHMGGQRSLFGRRILKWTHALRAVENRAATRFPLGNAPEAKTATWERVRCRAKTKEIFTEVPCVPARWNRLKPDKNVAPASAEKREVEVPVCNVVARTQMVRRQTTPSGVAPKTLLPPTIHHGAERKAFSDEDDDADHQTLFSFQTPARELSQILLGSEDPRCM